MQGSTERIAVIAVHGVADQAAGQTARELAVLLQNATPGACSAFEAVDLLVPLQPEATATTPATTTASFAEQQAGLRRTAAAVQLEETAPLPYDIAYSQSFLDGVELSAADRTYHSVRLRGRRNAARGQQQLDIFELYWADLSRLGTSLLRIAGEFYQLLFHLAYLARIVVAHARNYRPAAKQRDSGEVYWALLHRLHSCSEVLLTRPIVLINAFMLVVAVAFAVLLLPPEAQRVLSAIALLLSAMAATLLCWWRFGWGGALSAMILFGFGTLYLGATGVLASLLDAALLRYCWSLLVAGLLYVVVVRRIGQRIQGVEMFGYLTPALMLGLALWQTPQPWSWDTSALMVFSVRLLETCTLALVAVFSLLASCNALLYLVGLLSRWLRDPATATPDRIEAEAGSILTARVGVFLGTLLFALFTVSAWGVLEWLMHDHVPALPYRASFILPAASTAAEYDIATHLNFLIGISARSFGMLAGAFAILVLFSVMLLALPLLREIWPQPRPQLAPRVGAWLDDGVGHLVRAVQAVLFVMAFGGVLYQGILLTDLLQQQPIGVGDVGWFSLMVSLLAGSGVTLIVLGSLASGLRGVLDVILDVDNYFKDRPAQSAPRGRIYARYQALLQHVACQRFDDGRGYDRIVIVAHSQGTVITADLLRLLARNGDLARWFGQRPLHFVTAGSPLRQLYAARFPDLYHWVRAPLAIGTPAADLTGPDPRALGLASWTNLYQSGDYVGRVLWNVDGTQRYTVPEGESGVFSQRDRYADIRELCVGSGAHTHYFDGTAPRVAQELERLLNLHVPGQTSSQ